MTTLQRLDQDYDETIQRARTEIQRAIAERDGIRSQLDETRKQLNSIIQDRSRIASERDDLQLRISDLGLKSKKSMERVQTAEGQWIKEKQSLLEQIKKQDEQLKGKRALWLDAHPESSARRDAMSGLPDPFGSPSPTQPRFEGKNIGSTSSPSTRFSPRNTTSPSANSIPQNATRPSPSPQNYGPAPPFDLSNVHTWSSKTSSSGSNKTPGRRSENSPMYPANPASDHFDLHIRPQHDFKTLSEIGDDSCHTMIFRKSLDDLLPEYKTMFGKVYTLIENWARTFADVPNKQNDRKISDTNEILWNYMVNLPYPGQRRDAEAHVVELLNSRQTRFWFVMRMAVTYCTKDIMSIDSFKPFSKEVDDTIEDVRDKLGERGNTAPVSSQIYILLTWCRPCF